MNETMKRQLEHRTIREFKAQAIAPEVLNQLLEIANRTATSNGMQNYSIIRVTDPEKRKAIAAVCRQEYIVRAPEWMLFIVDVKRNADIAKAQGEDLIYARDMDRFFQGVTDASLAAQNMTNAIESLGMGAGFFGSVLNHPDAIREILEMPELTFPVVGLGFGWPDQAPQLKPRMGLELKVFENRYALPDDILKEIEEYDQEMQTYYDLRDANRRVDSFSKQVVTKLKNPIIKRSKIMESIERAGFQLFIDE